MSDRVTCSIAGGVADVRLNRPEKLNALDPETFAALVEVGEALKTDRSVRAVVLSGEGRGFCAGLDFSSFQAMAGEGEGDTARSRSPPPGQITNSGQQAAYVWTEMPVPVIAAVHGVALGGACRSPWGPICASSPPTPGCRSWRCAGAHPDMTGRPCSAVSSASTSPRS